MFDRALEADPTKGVGKEAMKISNLKIAAFKIRSRSKLETDLIPFRRHRVQTGCTGGSAGSDVKI